MSGFKLPKLPEKSIFGILIRSPCWKSFLVAAGIVAVGWYFERLRLMAVMLSVPFVIVGFISLWRRRNLPSASQVEKIVDQAMLMPRQDFYKLLEEAFQRRNFEITRHKSGIVDYELKQGSRIVLVACSRWKAASHGQEPLKELVAVQEKKEAQEAWYVCLNPLTDAAEEYAKRSKIKLVRSEELAQLLKK